MELVSVPKNSVLMHTARNRFTVQNIDVMKSRRLLTGTLRRAFIFAFYGRRDFLR
jgi:hypothetical protein